jgi:hypothetical protein
MKLSVPRLSAVIPWALAASAAIATIVMAASLFSGSGRSEALASMLAQYAPDPPADAKDPEPGGNTSAPKPGGPKAQAGDDERLKRISGRNSFARPNPFSATLTGVLGDKAYFQGDPNGHKEGERFREATIKRIGPCWVELEVDGKPRKLEVFAGGPSGGSHGGMMTGSPHTPMPMPPGMPPGMVMGAPGGMAMPSGPPSAAMQEALSRATAMKAAAMTAARSNPTTQKVNP